MLAVSYSGVKVDVATINSARLEVFSLSAKHTLKGYYQRVGRLSM